jgi:hypothetical protein
MTFLLYLAFTLTNLVGTGIHGAPAPSHHVTARAVGPQPSHHSPVRF